MKTLTRLLIGEKKKIHEGKFQAIAESLFYGGLERQPILRNHHDVVELSHSLITADTECLQDFSLEIHKNCDWRSWNTIRTFLNLNETREASAATRHPNTHSIVINCTTYFLDFY